MIKKKSKSLLSLLLSLAMLVTLVATPVYAADADDVITDIIAEESTGETTGASEEIQDKTVDGNEESEEAEELLTVTSDEADEESEEQTESVSVGNSVATNESSEESFNDGIAVIDEDVDATSEDADGTLLSEAVDGVITLTGNVTLSTDWTVSGTVTLNLAGYTLDLGSNKIVISNSASLTVNDTTGGVITSSNTSRTITVNGGTLTVNGGTIVNTGTSGGWGCAAIGVFGSTASTAASYSTVNVNSGATLKTTNADGDKTKPGYGVAVYYNSGVATNYECYGVTVNISGQCEDAYLYVNGSITKNVSSITFNLDGATITGQYGIYAAGYATWNVTNTTINGVASGIEIRAGELNVSDSTITASSTESNTTVNWNGATVTGAGIAVSQHSTSQAITVNITDSTVSGYYGVREVNNNSTTNAAVSVTISGNSTVSTTTTDGSGAAVLSDNNTDSMTTVEVTGGTYNTDVSAYTTSASAAVANGDGTYSVVETVEGAVAVVYDASGNYIGSTASLSYISSLADNCIVQLIADVSEKTFTLKTNTGVTLDLNGHSMTCTANSSYPYSPIYVTGGSLTVIDSTATDGVVDSVLSTTKGNGVVFVTGGDVTINAGNYISYSSSGQTVQISPAATDSTVTINNGTFTSVGYGMQVQAGTLNINGGTIASSVTTIDGDETTYTPSVRGAVLVRASSTTDSDGNSTDIIPCLNIEEGYFTSIYNDSGMIVYAVDKTTNAATSPVDFTDYISISGGYYDMNNYSVARYLVDGYEVATNTGDNSSTYPYVVQTTAVASGSYGYGYATIDTDGNVTATIMGTYTDLSGAIYRADLAYDNVSASGDYYAYVQLGSEVNLSLTSSVGSSTTYPKLIIDLNGASISSTATVFQVGAGSELILLDSVGTATVTSSIATAGTLRNAGGTLTIYGGTYINTDTTNSYSPVIYSANVSGGSAETATTIIYDGTFKSKGRAIHLNLGTAALYGGTYTAKALSYSNATDNTVSYKDGYGAFVTNTDSSTGTTYYTWIIAVTLGVYDSTTTVPGEITSGEGESVMYVEVSGDDIGVYSTSAYPTTSLTYTGGTNDSGKYIFAGWYDVSTDDEGNTTYTAMTSFPKETAYAKFVDANALTVKCVVSTVNEATRWRFMTSLDTLYYTAVGFTVIDSSNSEVTLSKTSIWKNSLTVTSVDPEITTKATEFSSASTRVATAYFDDAGNTKQVTYTVTPYWTTGDGTTVTGETVSFTYEKTVGALTADGTETEAVG